ncbi:MAG: hypothetical protein NZ958_07460 [Bacteroidia bacterium]|nr:hypothetical protein [Bacteroidia bacterium]MDW8088679.1 hypothetical protein [Bacteroidia bacterium]
MITGLGSRGVFFLAFLVLGCRREAEERPNGPPPKPEPVDFEVRVGEECFILRLRDSVRIAEARRILAQQEGRTIPLGPLYEGDGGFNRCGEHRWSWHFHPDSVIFAEIAMEVCDARPSYVEANLAEWLRSVRVYCPWGAQLVRELPPSAR